MNWAEASPTGPVWIPSKDLIEILDVPYKTVGDRHFHLDVFQPNNQAQNRPVMIFLHGNAAKEGHKESQHRLAKAFAKLGYVTVAVEYHLYTEALFPAQIEDVHDAIHFVLAKTQEWGLSADALFLSGSSSGSHLASLIALNAKQWVPPQKYKSMPIKGVVCLSMIADFISEAPAEYLKSDFDRDVEKQFRETLHERFAPLFVDDKASLEKILPVISPVNYVSNQSPPFFIVHGDRDPVIPYWQSLKMAEVLQQNDVRHQLLLRPGGDHGPLRGSEWLKKSRQMIDAFFKQIIKSP